MNWFTINSFLCFAFYFVVYVVIAQSNGSETASVSNSSLVSTTPITTSSDNSSCRRHDNDCKACTAYSECYFCDADNKCYSKTSGLPNDNVCRYSRIYYLTCRVNFVYMMIGIGVLSLVGFLIVTLFCCYCCFKKKGIRISKDDLKWARQKEERKQIALEKRQERAERTDEIRKKYGLVKNNPYQRFDA